MQDFTFMLSITHNRSADIFQNEDDNSHLAYWLTSTSALLFLLEKSLKTGGSGATQSKKPPASTSLFGRMAMVSLTIFSELI